MFVPHRKHIESPLRSQQVNAIIGLCGRYINITITVLDSTHRPAFYLKRRMGNVHTSHETHNV
jgi:hypothetical protein